MLRLYISREFHQYIAQLPLSEFPSRGFRLWLLGRGIKRIGKNRQWKLTWFVQQVRYRGIVLVTKNPYSAEIQWKRLTKLRPWSRRSERK